MEFQLHSDRRRLGTDTGDGGRGIPRARGTAEWVSEPECWSTQKMPNSNTYISTTCLCVPWPGIRRWMRATGLLTEVPRFPSAQAPGRIGDILELTFKYLLSGQETESCARVGALGARWRAEPRSVKRVSACRERAKRGGTIVFHDAPSKIENPQINSPVRP